MVFNKGRCAWVTSVGLAVSMALVGCSGSTEVDSTPTPSTPTPSVSATLTPTPSPAPTPSTASEQAAVDTVVEFLGVIDKLSIDPATDLNELNTVASGRALAQWMRNLMQYRVQGWRQVGEQTSTFVGSTPGSSAAQWFIRMCVDVSGLDVLDAEGVSVRPSDGSTRVLTEFEVDHQAANDTWYVATDEVKETC